MHARWLFTLLSIASIPVFARPPDSDLVHWQSLADAESAPSHGPMLVYFGAEWCGPCKTLETVVFNQPEVQNALKPFRTAYIDGDAPGALESMGRFNVKVFPSLVAIGRDGKETARIVGSAEKREFMAFLTTATLAEGPAAMLARFERDEPLDAAQWKLLSQIDIQSATAIRPDDEKGQAALLVLQAQLARAAEALDARDTSVDGVTEAWIRLKSLIVDAASSKPEESIGAHRTWLKKVLGDTALRPALESHLFGYSAEILDYLEPSPGASKRKLARSLLDALEAAYARPDASLPWKAELLMYAMPLLDHGSDNLDADKSAYAGRAEEAAKQATDPKSRLAIIANVVAVLRGTGRDFRAEAVVRETLEMAPEAYWLHVSLSRYAKQRGDLEAAAALAERGYRGSIPHMDALAYGPSWIQALIDRDPSQIAPIAAAADDVFTRASKSKDVFREWHADAWVRFAGMLGTWAAADKTARGGTITRFAERFDALCAGVKADAEALKACKSATRSLSAPAPAAG